ncbi:lamin tail domain-containing protein [Candidatus Nanosalina sp. VS9-1]|uniref:lamin tail domain-containing protein n=1 Tax=Candidatus Nanosalina sp. VS9-1 TaxID=3388566 RepID=UPI0039E1BB1F
MASDRTGAIISAFILTALLAFPTASQNVDFGSESTPMVSDTSNLQTDVDIEAEDFSKASIEESDSLYTVKENPFQRIEKLSTPRGTLTLKVNNTSRIYTLEMAAGTLVEGLKDGLSVSRFKGANRTVLENRMQSMKESMDDYRARVRNEMTPEVDVRITRSKASDEDERAVIDNDENREIDLDGWTLTNSDPDSYTFENIVLEPGEQLFVYTAAEDALNVSEEEDSGYVYGTGVDWDETSDRAVLEDSDGVVIDRDSH